MLMGNCESERETMEFMRLVLSESATISSDHHISVLRANLNCSYSPLTDVLVMFREQAALTPINAFKDTKKHAI